MNFKKLTKFSFYLPKSKILLYGNHEYRNEQIDHYMEKLGKNVLKKRWKIIRISSTKKKKCKLQTHINHMYTFSLTSLLICESNFWNGKALTGAQVPVVSLLNVNSIYRIYF